MTTPDKGQTIRFPATALLTIDSEDRWKDQTQKRTASENNSSGQYDAFLNPFNFSLQGNQIILSGFFTRLGVSEVVMPWCPNINRKTSYIGIDYVKGGTTYTTILNILPANVGVYTYATPIQIASLVQNAVSNVDSSLAGFVCTYGAGGRPRFDYAVPPGAVTAFRFFPLPANSVAFPFGDTVVQLFDLLALPYNAAPSTTLSQVGGITYAQPIRYVDIVAPYLTQYQGVFDGSSQTNARDSLCRVYLDGFLSSVVPSSNTFTPAGTAPTVVKTNYNNPKQIQWIGKQNVSAGMNFQVYGDDGELFSTNFGSLNDLRNVNWSMTLLVSEN